jgi:hypothetical protein
MAAGQGKIKNSLVDSGDMWIVVSLRAKTEDVLLNPLTF